MKPIKEPAKKIWNWLAFIQSKIDDLFDYGFSKLSNSTSKELPHDAPKVKKYAFKFWGFIWDIGKNYYQRYSEIKEEQMQEKKAMIK